MSRFVTDEVFLRQSAYITLGNLRDLVNDADSAAMPDESEVLWAYGSEERHSQSVRIKHRRKVGVQ